MKQQADIKSLGTILGVWAHPDDETMVCGGLMAEAVQNGQKVVCVTFTKGEAGKTADEKRWPKSRLAEIRAEELEEALKIYGIAEHYWFDYHDGKLNSVIDHEPIMHLVDIIKKVRPDTIITFSHDGITGHEDHKAVCRWVCQAALEAEVKVAIFGACESKEHYSSVGKKYDALFDIYWNVDEPEVVPESQVDLCCKLSGESLQIKLRAMKAQPSQYDHFFKGRKNNKLTSEFVATECFKRLN